MLEARSFFEDEVLSTMPSQPGPEGNKTPLWEHAKMVKISLGDALVVPIKYEKPQGIKAEGEKTFRDLQKSSYLLIYKDKKQNMQAEWVSLAPIGEEKNDKFVGIILVHEWNGKAKHAFAINQNGNIALMQETNVFFRKASIRNSVLCYDVHYTYVDIRHDENGREYPVVIGYTRTNCITINDYDDSSFQDLEYDYGSGGVGGNIAPYEYTDKIDCAGVVRGKAKFSAECQTCIGGTTGIDKCPTDSLKKIMKTKNDCLTSGQTTALNNEFNDYLYNKSERKDWDCLHQYIYQKIEESGIKIGVCINPTIKGMGAYRVNEKNVLFRDESMLEHPTIFRHEFFHVFQDAHYTGGTEQYHPIGAMNLEFEDALFNDIIAGAFPSSAMMSGTRELKEEYEAWIVSITNNFKTKPKQFSDLQGKYDYFLNQFNQHSGYAGGDAKIRPGFQPNALLTIFSKTNCDLQH